jgi:hypothetical protein
VSTAQTPAPNRYDVREAQVDGRWEVQIVDPADQVVWTRACAGESEARTFASTVRQHVSWLSEDKFREYYRIG